MSTVTPPPSGAPRDPGAPEGWLPPDPASVSPTAPHIGVAELVRLCTVDTELYGKAFFPQTFRHASPSFAKAMWEPMEDPNVRLVNLVAFRGSSKTSRARIFASKRIAYGISRTILYVGVSEGKAIESVIGLI